MPFVLNPITGKLDEVEVPLRVDTTVPSLNADGEIRIYFDGTDAWVYWRTNGVTYKKKAIQG